MLAAGASSIIPNHRLAATLDARHIPVLELARALQVVPKTVHRWLGNQSCAPHPSTRAAVARYLDACVDDLWPASVVSSVDDRQTDELTALYPARTAVPPALIGSLMACATDRIDILAISANYLWETVDGLLATLSARAAEGVQVRILLADPDGEALAIRGEEEGMGRLIRARAQLAWAALEPLAGTTGIELLMHDTTLYATVLRADEDLLVNVHVFGLTAAAAPVLHLRRQAGGRVADTYLESLERVANRAVPAGKLNVSSRRINRPRVLRPVVRAGA